MLVTEFTQQSETDFVYLDIETSGPSGVVDDLDLALPNSVKLPQNHGGLSLGRGAIALVSLLKEEDEVPTLFHYQMMSDDGRFELLDWMFNGKHSLVAHNACFDISFLLKEALRLDVSLPKSRVVLDTMQMSKVEECLKTAKRQWRNGPAFKHSLSSCCLRHLDFALDKTQQTSNWSDNLTNDMITYAEQDVLVLRQLLGSDLASVTEQYLEALLSEGQAIYDVSLVAARGMPVNERKLLGAISSACSRLEELERELNDKIDVKVITAPAMTKALSKDGVALLPDARGNPQCNNLTLNLARDEHPAIPVYLEHRSTKQEAQSLLSIWTGFDPSTGRVYSLLNSWSAPSGRLSSSKPNLMSLPKSVRGVIEPPNSSDYLSVADLSQIQVRAVAKVSGCDSLAKEFSQNGDVHSALAAKIHKKEPQYVTSIERSSAKPGTFGFLFGGGVETFLKSQIERGNIMSWDDAAKTKYAFSEAFPGVIRWQRQKFSEMKSTRGNGKLDHTVGGLPFLAKTGTQNLNYSIQAYDALILKLFLHEAHKLGWSVIGLLHDEVVVENVPCDEVIELLETVGEVVMDFPVIAEGKEQRSWAA